MHQIQNTGVVGVTSRCSWLWLAMLWSYARELTAWAAAAAFLKEKGQQVVVTMRMMWTCIQTQTHSIVNISTYSINIFQPLQKARRFLGFLFQKLSNSWWSEVQIATSRAVWSRSPWGATEQLKGPRAISPDRFNNSTIRDDDYDETKINSREMRVATTSSCNGFLSIESASLVAV